MSNFYDQLCETFIRPSRQTYNIYDLGQPINEFGKRYDFQLKNNRLHTLVGSFYANNKNPDTLCIVYLHSLNGSRLQSLPFVQKVLMKGFNFCSFDFSGTGISQGNYVSLGYFQKFDIYQVLKYIKEKFNVGKVLLWGRSMGAAAAIKFVSFYKLNCEKKIKNLQLSGLILDSAFHSIYLIAIKIAKDKISLPQILIKAALALVQNSIYKKAGFKISQMQMLEDVKCIQCPVLLLTSKEDKLVDCSQTQQIYDSIQHKQRQIIYIKGEHNSSREQQIIQQLLKFAMNPFNKKHTEREAPGKQVISLKVKKEIKRQQKGMIRTLSPRKLQQIESENSQKQTFGCTKLLEDLRYRQRDSKKSLHIFSPKFHPVSDKIVKLNNSVILQNENKSKGNHSLNSTKKIFHEIQNSQGAGQKQKKKSNQQILTKESNSQPYLEINKSPIKGPPTMNVEKQSKKQPLKNLIRNQLKKNMNEETFYIDLMRSEDTADRDQAKRKGISGNSLIEVSHLNVINDKLKKKRRRRQQQSLGKEVKIEGLRMVSVSLQRKPQLSIKYPPEFVRLRPQNQHISRKIKVEENSGGFK